MPGLFRWWMGLVSSLVPLVGATGAVSWAAAPPWAAVPPVIDAGLPDLEFPAYYSATDRARLEVFTGRYRTALARLSADPSVADGPEPTRLRAEALSALGRREAALLLLDAPALANDAPAAGLRGRLLTDLGRFDDAIAALRAATARHPDAIDLHLLLAQALESSGDIDAAKAAYAWFVEPTRNFVARLADENDALFSRSAADLTAAARGVDRWATLHGAYERDRALHDTLLNAFVRAYDQVDRRYWPARVASAEYWLSHDGSRQALAELKAANAINPSDARLNELFGLIALDGFNFDGADEAVRALRAVEAQSVRADLLEARTLLASRRPLAAEEPLRRVLARRPDDVNALGLLAAARALRLRDDQAADLLREIDRIDPGNATAAFEVAEQLGAMRQYPRAEAMYLRAIERAPWWTAPRNGLGLLYTQSGDEDAARAALDAAHALDPFNLRTTNYLRLLDDLARFDRLETENFIILYDSRLDPVIAEPMAAYLESIHGEVARTYRTDPDEKTLIEVFPTHDAFSVRTTGSPWIGTVGASTGRVIAMVSPRRGQQTMGTYNWARVLRHEYTHTITLAATENRIPHWMTEGLAVLEERKPIPWEWVPLLNHAVKNDELFTLEELTWGFVRPKKPTDRTLAYAQSHWVCQYVVETAGFDAILKMLGMFREGKLQEEVFPAVLGKSLTQFEEEFFAWTRRQVAGWGYDPATQEKYDLLRERGEALIKSRQYAEAVPVWEEIAAIRPMDALPQQRLAGLYLNKDVNRPEQAIAALRRLIDVEINDARYAKRLTRLYRDLGRWPEAVATAREATMIDPYDLDAQRLLAEVFERSGDAAGLERQRAVLATLERWHAENRRQNRLDGPTPEPPKDP